MKEMVGGCCVCSDERGWPENPLVYCDGQNCTVAVHQACYGIVTVPTGPWYCRKCESQERSARVRCELCPSRDGALKKTDNQGWAHVVCALYIPEVRFGNVTTMEPIILQLIPAERYAKTCYICQDHGKGNRATAGACMQCNRPGCKQQFHVTCAQGLGLLCEEAGNYLDNVKYCGYCQYHYSKLKKGGNVKTIPPYKPINHESSSSDANSSPEKDTEPAAALATNATANLKGNVNLSGNTSALNSSSSSTTSSKQRKSGSNKVAGSSSSSSTSNNSGGNLSGSGGNAGTTSAPSTSGSAKNSSSSSGSSKDKEKHVKNLNKSSSSSKGQDKETSSSTTSSTRDRSKYSKSNKDSTNSEHSGASTAGVSAGSAQASNLSLNSSSQSTNSKDNMGQKFGSHSFAETVAISADHVYSVGSEKQTATSLATSSLSQTPSSASSYRDNKNSSSSNSSSGGSSGKKRKADSSKLSSSNSSINLGGSGIVETLDINNHHLALRDIIKDVSVTLIPLPMEKTQDIVSNDGGSEKVSLGKKPKTEPPVSSPHPDISLQSASQGVIGNPVPSGLSIKQQAITIANSSSSNVPQSSGNTNSSSSISTSPQLQIKPPILKDVSDSRNRSSSPYNTSAAISSGSGTPSLYVSVPLSNAIVPGVNLPSANANEHVTQSSSRSSPLVNHSHLQSSILLSSQPSVSERQSPRILQNQSLHLTDRNSPNSFAHSSALSQHTSSNMSPTLNQRTDSTSMDTSGLKITYEKQNLRVAQLQEEQLPARRSRSQSGDSSSKSSRSGKKRSSTGSSSSAASSSNASVTMPSKPAAMPTGSNTENEGTAITPATRSTNNENQLQQNKQSNSKNLSENAINTGGKGSGSSSSSSLVEAPQPPISNTSAPQNTKQMNKKMLRAQQSQQHQQQKHQPTPPPSQLLAPQQQQSVAAAAQPQPSSTASITSTTTLLQSEDINPPNSTTSSNSRTPDSANLSILASSTATSTPTGESSGHLKDTGGGLKFTYESQIGGPTITAQAISPHPLPIDSVLKESPPSSPGSEAGSGRKRGRKSAESKDNVKSFFHNGVHASHMLGNHLNPTSSVAQKMSDQLHMEMEAHSIYTQSVDMGPQLVGVPLPGKGSMRNSSQSTSTHSLSSMLGGANTNSSSGNTPQSLEQLLERQWEQGSQFLMEQAQHFDIASLLSCLHQLRTENVRLEEHVNSLIARRDHLLAVNARLAIPLNPNVPPNATLNNLHMNGPTGDAVSSRLPRSNAHYNTQQSSQQQQQSQLPVENGIDFRHSSHPPATNSNPSTISRHSSANLNYSSSTPSIHNQQQSQHSVLSSSSSSSAPPPSNNRQQQPLLPRTPPQQQQQQQQHQSHQQIAHMVGTAVSSVPASIGGGSSASDVPPHPSLIRGTSGVGRITGSGPTANTSSNNSSICVGLVGTGIGGGGGGGGGNIGLSSYHNATQQSAAYSTVHQSQLRRDDSHGKPS